MNNTTSTLVIGGGLYGIAIAIQAAGAGAGRVVLVERGSRLLGGASFANQARVHHGYHYPRSFLTGARSRQRYRQFISEYADCIDGDIEAYYAIAKSFSKVTARQFVQFCDRIGAPVGSATQVVRDLFDRDVIEDVFRVEEAAFDPTKLSARLEAEARAAGVEILLATEVCGLRQDADGWRVQLCAEHTEESELRAQRVYNCTYGNLNDLLILAGEPPVPLKHELAELALVDPPSDLVGRAVTIMCGPFFSITPFPAERCHVLSHVRYTPHRAWTTGTPAPDGRQSSADLPAQLPTSRAAEMVADARRFLPCVADATYRRSIWAVKTVLPRNEIDDGRPILLHRSKTAPGLVSVMGSKIDNVYDVLEMLESPAIGVAS